jgi:hypothetical protein
MGGISLDEMVLPVVTLTGKREGRTVKLNLRHRLLLIFFGLLALYSALAGYSGLQARLTASPTAKAEARFAEIVEKAQYYYHRPAHLQGGGMSFEGLDFARLGFDTPSGTLEWRAPEGTFRLENLRPHNFDLTADMPAGRLEARNLTMDARAESTKN